MPHLQKLPVRPRYLVAGSTHPKVLAADGESYRNARIEQAWRNGVAASVEFDADYRDVPTLTAMIQSCAAVVLPYDSQRSGHLGCARRRHRRGTTGVATAFPHAVEMLASGAGIIVDHDDPDAMVRRADPIPHRPGSRRRGWRQKRADLLRPSAGRSWPPRTSSWPTGCCWTERRWYDRRAATPVRPPAPHDRRAWHVRARRVDRAATGARLLHRRHGAGPRRVARASRTPVPPCGTSSSSACASWATPRASTATTATG